MSKPCHVNVAASCRRTCHSHSHAGSRWSSSGTASCNCEFLGRAHDDGEYYLYLQEGELPFLAGSNIDLELTRLRQVFSEPACVSILNSATAAATNNGSNTLSASQPASQIAFQWTGKGCEPRVQPSSGPARRRRRRRWRQLIDRACPKLVAAEFLPNEAAICKVCSEKFVVSVLLRELILCNELGARDQLDVVDVPSIIFLEHSLSSSKSVDSVLSYSPRITSR